MNHRLLFFLALSNGLLAGAQTVNLRGAVTSGGGKPVSGAIVTLLKMNLKDTTGADGTYAITKTITGISPRSSGDGIISLSGGVLEFELVEPAPVVIEVFDIKSNLLKVENLGVQGAGHYSWNIPGIYGANKLLIVRASVGNKVSTFRCMPSTGGNAAFTKSPSSGRAMAKTAAAVDSLEVTASGHASKTVMVEAYDAQLNVSLTAVDNSGDKWGGLKNPPGKSAGCGKPAGLTTGIKTSTTTGEYAVDVPANYDMNTPHIVIFTYISVGGTAANVVANNFYRLKPIATAVKKPTIFIGPTHGAKEVDHSKFNALLELVKANLCIDSTRVFATGYSYGGMMTYSLSTQQQKKLRAAAAMAAANFNVWLPNPKLKEPIAYFGISAMADATCPWDGGNGRGNKYIALEKAADNGCEIPTEITTWKTGNHVVFEFKNCKSGYPVVQSTLGGGHPGIPIAKDPGASESWVPKEIWEFFMRF
jgi:predicted esterase